MRVFIAGSLTKCERIAFNAGSHTELIKMACSDYLRLVEPQTARFTYRRVKELKGMA
jgi:Ala-tRNA(Pro) deacylase